MSILLEVCIDSVESAVAAKAGGADRLEVCSSLAADGTTPSYGLVKLCVEQVQLPVMMMIRPHDGGFVYSDADIEAMLIDIEIGHSLGVQGFVFGMLTDQRNVHVEQCTRLVQAAGWRETTFHRAFDVVPNPLESFQELIAIGFTRLLTSGQKSNAEDGIPLIQQLTELARNRVIVLPGTGVNPANAPKIISSTGVCEIHSTAAAPGSGQAGEAVAFGEHRRVTCSEIVRSIKQSLSEEQS